MERTTEDKLREALYAINRAITEDLPPLYRDSLVSVRDNLWHIGVINFGWRD